VSAALSSLGRFPVAALSSPGRFLDAALSSLGRLPDAAVSRIGVPGVRHRWSHRHSSSCDHQSRRHLVRELALVPSSSIE